MHKRLLVAVSDDPSVYFGLRFLSRFFTNRDDLSVTLLHMARRAPEVWGDEDPDLLAMRENLVKTYEERARQVLQTAESLFRYEGFPADNVHSKYLVRQFSRPRELLLEGEEGAYDALVLGRRGIRRVEDMLQRDTCRNVLEEAFCLPVWICRRPDVLRQEVLLCADGSGPSIRMAGHVARMVSDEPRHRVCVLHVRTGQTSEEQAREIVDQTTRALVAEGLPEERIFGRVEQAGHVARTVMARAEAGNFAVVACGRTGAGKGTLERLFLGSVTDELFKRLTGAVLWVSR